MTNSFLYVNVWQMLGFSTKRRIKNRSTRKVENPLMSEVRKVLAATDQKLIVMVKN